ncbi:MAG: fumarylacetoacetate hydrolase family protein, partial [Chloroflexi bacterium]|nr:fumarylacetoacetate hydrolase family protein [Chloroflexota bacterium]
MKLVLFNGGKPGVLKGDHVVDISPAVGSVSQRDAQELMAGIIANFAALRPEIERLVAQEPGVPLASVGLMAPLPRPSKILCVIGNYKEGTHREPQAIDIFLKNPDAVIGPGGTVVLPDAPATIFHHEAELAVVIGQAATRVSEAQALDHVFGYTTSVDVSARAPA